MWRFFLIASISLLSLRANSQTIEQTYNLANELYQKKEFKAAVDVYRRVIHFDKDEQYRNLCYSKIAESLFQVKEYEEATGYFDLAYFQETNDSTKTEILFRKASCYMLTQNYEYAQIEMLSLSDSITKSLEDKKTFYWATLNFALGNYKDSEFAFVSVLDDNEKKEKIKSLFLKNEKVSRISPKKARILSMILPGLGQFYAGDIKNGLNSMLLTGGLFYLGIRTGMNNGFLDAVFSVFPWIQRYYMGGYAKAETIAQNQKQKKRVAVYNEILDVVEK